MDGIFGCFHGLSDLRDCVGSECDGMDTVFTHPGGYFASHTFILLRTFQITNLQIPSIQNKLNNFQFIRGPKDALQIILLGEFSLTHIRKDSFCLQYFGKISLNSLSVVDHLVSIACNLKAFATLCHSDDSDIG